MAQAAFSFSETESERHAEDQSATPMRTKHCPLPLSTFLGVQYYLFLFFFLVYSIKRKQFEKKGLVFLFCLLIFDAILATYEEMPSMTVHAISKSLLMLFQSWKPGSAEA